MGWLGKLVDKVVPRYKHYETALKAIRNGDKAGLEHLLRQSPLLIRTSYCINGSLLHNAALNGQVEIAEMLIARGAKVNDPSTRDNETPLHFAAMAGKLEMVKVLVEHGADIEARDISGRTAIEMAADEGHNELVRALEQMGAPHSPIHTAATLGDVVMLDKALAHGIDPDVKDRKNETALQLAINDRHIDAVRALIRAGADVNAKDANERTMLCEAVATRDSDLVRVLIESGADTNARDRNGASPLDLATRYHDLKIARLLIDAGEENVSIHAAALVGDTPRVRERLAEGTDVNALLPLDHAPPLHLAAEGGHRNTVALLIENGADVNAQDVYGATALHYAAYGNCADIIELLVSSGADIDSRENLSRTPLHKAAENSAKAAIERLLDFGADVNAIDKECSTPLLLAAILSGEVETLELLIRRGGDINAARASGMTPLSAAIENGHEEAAALLRTLGAIMNKTF